MRGEQESETHIDDPKEGHEVLDGAGHVLHVADGGQEDGQLHLVGPGLVQGVHHHEGGGAHTVANILDLLLHTDWSPPAQTVSSLMS